MSNRCRKKIEVGDETEPPTAVPKDSAPYLIGF
jgi:hypothetical protein